MFVLSSNQDSDVGDPERYVCLGGGGGVLVGCVVGGDFFEGFGADAVDFQQVVHGVVRAS